MKRYTAILRVSEIVEKRRMFKQEDRLRLVQAVGNLEIQ